jgi:hypothetical protein
MRISKQQRALLDDFAHWFSQVTDLDADTPEHAVERFLADREAGENIREVFMLRDGGEDESVGWWVYLPHADAWSCVTIFEDEILERMLKTNTYGSAFLGFDEGAALIETTFGIAS